MNSYTGSKIFHFFILTFGNSKLEATIASLISSTNYELKIHIVNNNRTNSHHRLLVEHLAAKYSAAYYHCRNRWVLSLNHPDIQKIMDGALFYGLSDDDIIFPSIAENSACWISLAAEKMNKYPFVGKIGLPLISNEKLSPSDSRQSPYPGFRCLHFLQKERTILIDDLYHARVDTTPAIYRSRLFMPNSNIWSPRHMSLVKPHLYQCIFNKYPVLTVSNSVDSESNFYQQYLHSKTICFTLNAAYLSQDHISSLSFFYRLLYLAIKPGAYVFWSLLAVFRIALYNVSFHSKKY